MKYIVATQDGVRTYTNYHDAETEWRRHRFASLLQAGKSVKVIFACSSK